MNKGRRANRTRSSPSRHRSPDEVGVEKAVEVVTVMGDVTEMVVVEIAEESVDVVVMEAVVVVLAAMVEVAVIQVVVTVKVAMVVVAAAVVATVVVASEVKCTLSRRLRLDLYLRMPDPRCCFENSTTD